MKERTRRGKSPAAVLLTGTAAGLIAAFLLVCLLAFYITKKDVSIAKLPYYYTACCGIGCFICSFITSRKLKFRGILSGLICALIYSAVLLLITFILSGFAFSVHYAVIIIINIITGLIGGVISKNLR